MHVGYLLEHFQKLIGLIEAATKPAAHWAEDAVNARLVDNRGCRASRDAKALSDIRRIDDRLFY